MTVNSKTILLCLMLMLCANVSAGPISRQKARLQAASFMQERGHTLAEKMPYRMPRHQDDASAETAFYYVFQTEGEHGFVVVSGDDRTQPVLGFTEHGHFDETDIPEGLYFLLQMYQEQIQQLDAPHSSSSNDKNNAALYHLPTRHNVQPLMQTLWNQGDPYNLLCPQYYESDGSLGGHSATGCVATALAQVMNYYRYPAETVRYIPSYKLEYDTSQGKKEIVVQGIPQHSAIEWDKMQHVYDGNETEAEKTAVAQLMHWVGVGCRMSYGGSSAATMADALNALVTYFGYDDGSRLESRSNHSIESWSQLLYTEIATGHPIAFAACNSGGAHAFVLDGYDIEGLFHVNWGWGGLDNGYFRIDVMAPDDNSGIGASSTPDGYNMGQDAIIGLRLPDNVKAETQQPRLTVNDWEIRRGNTFFANYVNWTGFTATWDMGIGYVDETGALVPIGEHTSMRLDANYYIGLEFVVEGLSEGVYHIVPISKKASTKVWQTHVNPAISYIEAVVDGQGNVSLTQHPIEDVSITDISFPGNHKKGERQTVAVSFQNHGEEYFREIHLLASMTNQMGESVCRTAVTMVGEGETTASFSFVPDRSGKWHVWLSTDNHGNNILGESEVVITDEGNASAHSLRYLSHSISNKSNNVIYGNCMQGKVTVRNEAAETYNGKLRLWLFKLADDGYYYGASSVYVPVVVEPNATAKAEFYFDQLEYGKQYNMSILYEDGGDIMNGGLKDMGKPSRGIVYWQQDKDITGVAPSSVLHIPAAALAVDMTGTGNMVKTVYPNNNPNTIYMMGASDEMPAGLETRNVVVDGHADCLHLTDGYGFMSPLTFTAAEASYTRQPLQNQWETIALPFAPQVIPENVMVKSFTEESVDGTPCFMDVTAMDQCMPYLVYSSSADSLTFSASDVCVLATKGNALSVGTPTTLLVGTTVKKRLSDVFILDNESASFIKSVEPVTLEAFRACLRSATLNGPVLIEAPEGIDPLVTGSYDKDQYYDLQGRVVNRLTKGIYIRNHRKVIIR